MIRKIVLTAVVIAMTMSGCSKEKPANQEILKGNENVTQSLDDSTNGSDTSSNQGNQESGSKNKNAKDDQNNSVIPSLKMLSMYNQTSCNTEEGYYYLSETAEELVDGSFGRHLMYIDFATKQEIYLCSNSGCQHNTKNCNSVFDSEEFLMDSNLFVWKKQLYVLSKDCDDEGTLGIDLIGDASDVSVKTPVATLYCMDLDGSNRRKLCTFEAGLTVENSIFGDDQSLYFITKKLSSKRDGNTTYTTSTDRKLVRFQVETSSIETVCSLDFHDGLKWNVVGCNMDRIVFHALEYANGKTEEEIMKCSDEEWREINHSSQSVYMTFNITTAEKNEVYRCSNQCLHNEIMKNEFLYISRKDSGDIEQINILTGNKDTVTTLKQNYLCGVYDDVLCCQNRDTVIDDNERYGFI
ncbi:MAG: hypothetical protein PUC65_13315 [Clostridiales bacterium]|nr:hypothetical protein [Clostridiales bacterium]